MQELKPRFDFESLFLDPANGEPLYRQIETHLRRAIVDGLLLPETPVPSTRELATLLCVSRNTVLGAYSQLTSEGYLEPAAGSGTRVARLLPDVTDFAVSNHHEKSNPSLEKEVSKTGRQLAEFAEWFPEGIGEPVPFQPHLPDIHAFPSKTWSRFAREQAKKHPSHLLPGEPKGYLPLRQQLAEYMAQSRGVRCSAEQIIITAGAQQALDLVLQILLNAGDEVWVENPGNTPAVQVLQLAGMKILPVGLDAEGMAIEKIPTNHGHPRLIYLTPGGQWPMGMTLSLNRRMEILKLAQRHQSWVIEDDYNGEFRYDGRPHPALSSLDPCGRTLYMGSFSKILFPAIRLGFLMVPTTFAKAFAYARWLSDRGSPTLQQMVLYRFIESGEFRKHIRRMRLVYHRRQQVLYEALRAHFGNLIQVELHPSGQHLVVFGSSGQVERSLMESAKRAGVSFHPVALYTLGTSPASGLILGFAAYDESAINSAVARWAREMKA